MSDKKNSANPGDPVDRIEPASDPPSGETPLLRAALAQAERILEAVPVSAEGTAVDARRALGAIPGYDLLREIHRGGQGIIFRAVQRSTGRIVALKLLRHGSFANAAERARFEREVRILARLDHPHIVTIHDSGEVDGQAFFVMDFIHGRPVDEFVAAERPALPTVLALLATIADALHAAHLRGVIHRDLKPANVLIDADGQPHILDFGLAKLTTVDDGMQSGVRAVTVTGEFIGTPPWASPEQVDGRTDDLDVRSDVYSLGVMLFQAATGAFPYPVTGRLRDIAENIRTATPVRPSTLRREIGEDCDTIVLKALGKDPARRYQSAGDLARDIRHCLKGEPIEARRDSTVYVLRKTLRRHWVAATVAAGFVLVIGASAVIMSVMYALARSEAAKAQAINRFFLVDMLVPDPLIPPRSDMTVAESLDKAAQRIESLRDQPELEAATRFTLGTAYRNVGLYDRAEPQFRASWEIRARVLGGDHQDTIEAKARTAAMLRELNRHDESEAMWREVVTAQTALLGADDPRTADSVAYLASARYDQGDFAGSEMLLRRALASLERRDVRDGRAARMLANLGTVLKARGELAAAATPLREAQRIYVEIHGADHPIVASTMLSLAPLCDDPMECERMTREALRIWEAQLGPDHPLVANALNSLGLVHRASDPEGALRMFERAIAIQRSHPGESLELATALTNAGGLIRERGQADAAEPLLREGLEIRRRFLEAGHPDMAASLRELGMLSFDRGDFAAAADQFREAVAILRANPSLDRMNLARTMTVLAQALRAQGELAAAATAIDESLEVIRALPGQPGLDDALMALGRLRVQTGKPSAAEAVLRECLELRRRDLPAGHWAIGNTESVLAGCLVLLRRYDEAEPLALNGHDALRATRGAGDVKTREAAERVVALYEAWGRPEDAERWRQRVGAP